MLNHQQMEFLAFERQSIFLDEAEQRRFAKLILPQPQPWLAWLGQQLIGWGQRLQGAEAKAVLQVTPTALAHSPAG